MDYQAYIDFINSEEYIALYDYNNQETFMDILGVSRQENPHSSFLRWLFDPSSNHGLGEYPLRKLIEAACCRYNHVVSNGCHLLKGKNNIFTINTNGNDNKKLLETGSYKLSNITVNREKVIERQRRADIVMDFLISDGQSGNKKMCIVIENKVYSEEQKDQTNDYAEFFLNKNKSGYDYAMLLFLKPIRSEELNKDNICESSEFLVINYQMLMDYVLEPCKQRKTGSTTNYLISDYIRCLGKAVEGANDTIMAVSKAERVWAKALWINHKETVMDIFKRMREDASEYDSKFYCALAYDLMIQINDLEGSFIDNEEISKTATFLQNSISRKRFVYKGNTYFSGSRGKEAIAYLARELLIEYVNKPENINKSIVDIRKKIRKNASISSDWHREILLTEKEMKDLRNKHCPYSVSEGTQMAATYYGYCPFTPKNIKKNISVNGAPISQYIIDMMNDCPLHKKFNNTSYREFAKKFTDNNPDNNLKYSTCCIEDAEHVYYCKERNERTGNILKSGTADSYSETHKFKKDGKTQDEKYYVARFFGADNVIEFAKLTGHKFSKKDDNVTEIN